MTDSSTIVALTAILGISALAAIVFGTRYQKRRRAERLRRRGYKEYNRGRPKLVIDPAAAQSTMADTATRP